MLRVIVKRSDTSVACNIGGPGTGADISYKTFDIEAPALEEWLRGGGLDEARYDIREAIGVEVLQAPESENPK